MVLKCCMPLCKNHAYTPNVSLHNFTKDAKLRKIWIHKIRRDTLKSKQNPKPFVVSQYTKICSAHFERVDFLIRSEKNRLKPTAIPSIFPWNSVSIDTKTLRSILSDTPNSDVIHVEEFSENTSTDVLLSEHSEVLHEDEKDQKLTENTETEIIVAAEKYFNVAESNIVKMEENNYDNFETVNASTGEKSTFNLENNDNLEYTKLRKLYTDLLAVHREFVKNCKCHQVKEVANINTDRQEPKMSVQSDTNNACGIPQTPVHNMNCDKINDNPNNALKIEIIDSKVKNIPKQNSIMKRIHTDGMLVMPAEIKEESAEKSNTTRRRIRHRGKGSRERHLRRRQNRLEIHL